jgi:hypothetical protein
MEKKPAMLAAFQDSVDQRDKKEFTYVDPMLIATIHTLRPPAGSADEKTGSPLSKNLSHSKEFAYQASC